MRIRFAAIGMLWPATKQGVSANAGLLKKWSQGKVITMTTTNQITSGSDVSPGTYECVDCGKIILLQSHTSLPPCPRSQSGNHPSKAWRMASDQGGPAYPDESD